MDATTQALGRVGEIVHPRVRDSACVVAVRRTLAGDALIVVAPGRPELVVEQGPARVEALDVNTAMSWRRDGAGRYAQLPLRRVRCADMTGEDRLAGPGRVTFAIRSAAWVGCTGAAGAPVFPSLQARSTCGPTRRRSVGRARGNREPPGRRSIHGLRHGLGLRQPGDGSHAQCRLGHRRDVATWDGERLHEQVLLADGRYAAILHHNFSGLRVGVATQSRVSVNGTTVDETERDAPMATNLRIEARSCAGRSVARSAARPCRRSVDEIGRDRTPMT